MRSEIKLNLLAPIKFSAGQVGLICLAALGLVVFADR